MTYMKAIEKIAQRYQRNNRRHQNDKQANDEGMGRRKEKKKTLPLIATLQEPSFTASMAYSTWNNLP